MVFQIAGFQTSTRISGKKAQKEYKVEEIFCKESYQQET